MSSNYDVYFKESKEKKGTRNEDSRQTPKLGYQMLKILGILLYMVVFAVLYSEFAKQYYASSS